LRFVREMVEVDLPPVAFESVGTPGFYLSALRPAAFAAGLWTHAPRDDYASVGAQLDFNLTVLNKYDMTLSFGAAVGYQGSQRAGTEWMISLKLM
jgi:hypothetical protein